MCERGRTVAIPWGASKGDSMGDSSLEVAKWLDWRWVESRAEARQCRKARDFFRFAALRAGNAGAPQGN